MYNAILCRYHEIATKGDNRGFFERKLLENLRWLLRDRPDLKFRRVQGRVWIEKSDRTEFLPEELDAIARELRLRALGLESFSPAVFLAPDMAAIRRAAQALCDRVFPPTLAAAERDGRKVSFRIRARRSDKKFPLHSKEIEIELATLIGSRYGDDRLDIDLSHGEITVGVEVREEFAVLFLERFPAPGGLPVGSNDRLLALLSGGIDSPVACYLMMKRGSPVDFLAFHSAPYTPEETVDKVRGIANYLNTFQKDGRLFFANLAPLQKLIRDRCNPRFRTVLYRRMMFRIAASVAARRKIGALLTGESLGQVASQTVVNMGTIDNATDMTVLRPLCGMDKMETIRLAEAIGTFPLSTVQVPDSCTVFAPPSPSTRVSVADAEAEEAKIPEFPELLAEIVEQSLSESPSA